VEGAANDELMQVIAKAFGAAKRDVTIVAGERSKLKRVAIATLERGQLEATLQSLGVDPKQLSW
jgi:uncharacterized protein YggU (UPF0235/DUF167 family)